MPLLLPAQAAQLSLALALTLILASCGPEAEQSTAPAPQAFNKSSGQLTILDPFDPKRPYFHDFGNVSYGQRLSAVFKMANTGEGPVTVLRAQPACTCTRVRSIRLLQDDGPPILGSPTATEGMLTIPKGAICELEIELDTSKTQANQDKLAVMRIITDEILNPFQTLELHVLAERLFELKPANVNLGEVPQYGGYGKTIQIYNRILDKPARLLDVLEASPGLEVKLEAIHTTGVPFWNLTVRLEKDLPLGGYKGEILLSHSNSRDEGNAGRLSVDVFARITEPVVLSPMHVSFGAIESGSIAYVKSSLKTLLPGQRIRILDATLEGPSAPHLVLETEALGEDSEGRATHFHVILRSKETLPLGRLDAKLVLDLDDSQVPRIERQIHGFVR